MKFGEMSDNEINELVADTRGGYAGNVYGSDSAVKVNDAGSGGLFYTEADYCNNPADAWPIVLKHRIMLNPYCADNLWKAEVPCGREDSFTTYATCYHKNPLRAAMIVYLMMREASNEQP